jgi:hypothetical protein
MPRMFFDRCPACLLAANLLMAPAEVDATEAAQAAAGARAFAGATVTPSSMFEYWRLVAEYRAARQVFEEQHAQYWNRVAEKRRERNAKRRSKQQVEFSDYVLTQPPVYTGPPRPVDPWQPEQPPAPRKHIAVVADFLQAAAEHFQFRPQRPASEMQYKREYARAAAAAGLTREQVVRIYAFESSGNGNYDVQAGLEYSPEARAISTALGYNQLLNANSVSLLAEHGQQILAVLRQKAAALADERKRALERKIAVVERMTAFTRTVPVKWDEHVKLAGTPHGLAVHALVLDIDVGPILQVQKLVNSLKFARSKGHAKPLTAAELEMLNLTGDGNGFDMITLPPELRDKVPTSNFFQPSGYARNAVARRNNTVSALIAATDQKMDEEAKLQGAIDMAAAFDGR